MAPDYARRAEDARRAARGAAALVIMVAMDGVEVGPLTVSRLCLGTMLMGTKTAVREAYAMLDAFIDAGHNFIDTADVYGDGLAEEILRPWLSRHRHEVIVTTKVRFQANDPGGEGLAPDRIRRACDASLRRMGIDVIDLYEVHAPDPDVPLEDTLEALDELVRAGRVRAIGASNYPAWLLAWAVRTQDCHGWAPFAVLQAQYSLVERSVEMELLPFCRSAGIPLTPWGPLGGGFLTGRHGRGIVPAAGSRVAEAADDLEEAAQRRATERNFRAIDELRAVADECGASVARVAIAWLLNQPGVAAPIIGPRTMEQLRDLLAGASLTLSADQLRRLGAHTAPPEIYPHRFLTEQNHIEPEQPLRRAGNRVTP